MCHFGNITGLQNDRFLLDRARWLLNSGFNVLPQKFLVKAHDYFYLYLLIAIYSNGQVIFYQDRVYVFENLNNLKKSIWNQNIYLAKVISDT